MLHWQQAGGVTACLKQALLPDGRMTHKHDAWRQAPHRQASRQLLGSWCWIKCHCSSKSPCVSPTGHVASNQNVFAPLQRPHFNGKEGYSVVTFELNQLVPFFKLHRN